MLDLNCIAKCKPCILHPLSTPFYIYHSSLFLRVSFKALCNMIYMQQFVIRDNTNRETGKKCLEFKGIWKEFLYQNN